MRFAFLSLLALSAALLQAPLCRAGASNSTGNTAGQSVLPTTGWVRKPLKSLRQRSSRPDLAGYRDRFGVERVYRRGRVLARFRDANRPEAIILSPGQEFAALARLQAEDDVHYAELDVVLTRQTAPSDPLASSQWHHSTIGSAQAWAISLATHRVTVAILDTPFQMDHPDLAPNTIAGWSMVTRMPITADSRGFYHSTIGAGLAGAVIGNSVGVRGVANCLLLPVDIGDLPSQSDMHDAVIWAADHGVRVVNLSWDGAFSSVINDAGAYLKQKNGGMLFMAGVNIVGGRNVLNYPNLPDIYAISMTDNRDQSRSASGPHIDFAAPGWQVYSTTTNSTYEVDSGTSYSSPLVAGVAAWIMSVNASLGPEQIEGILKSSAVDLGAPGWDPVYGWGRIDFGRAAELTFATLPVSQVGVEIGAGITVVAARVNGATYRLFRSRDFATGWTPVENASQITSENLVKLVDPTPFSSEAFYRVEITLPRELPPN